MIFSFDSCHSFIHKCIPAMRKNEENNSIEENGREADLQNILIKTQRQTKTTMTTNKKVEKCYILDRNSKLFSHFFVEFFFIFLLLNG